MKVQEILDGLAAAAQGIANSSSDATVKASAGAAAVLIALIGRVLKGRSVEEAKAVLEGLLKEGVTPVTQGELDAQAAEIIAALTPK